MSKILLIEDSPCVSRIIEWILCDGGHDVSAVNSAVATTERAAVYQPDVVVFNTGMPETRKRPYIDAIRQVAPSAKMIDLSTDAWRSRRADDRAEAGDVHGKVDVYLRIPFHADDLLSAIDHLHET
jgi:CheY-like chemotaxis protein